MQVLKFGGSSVANAKNMNQVVSIVLEAVKKEPLVLVLSAMGGVTDALLQTGSMAEAGNESYQQVLKGLEQKHLDAVRELLPIQQQSACLSQVKQKFNELEAISDGVFLLGELSERTRDRMVSYGEVLSSLIMAAKFQSIPIDQHWVDSRNLIKTNSHHGNALVDFGKTNQLIKDYLTKNPCSLYVAPGFIASDQHNHTTTLGRGGSDYTAAIYAAARTSICSRNLDRCKWHDDRRPKTGSQCQTHTTYLLSGSHGAFSFWSQDYLPANHSTCHDCPYSSMG